MLTVVLYCWLTGILNDSVELSARFSAGHVKIITSAYEKNSSQMPNDLALTGIDTLMLKLKKSSLKCIGGKEFISAALSMFRISEVKHVHKDLLWALESTCYQETNAELNGLISENLYTAADFLFMREKY